MGTQFCREPLLQINLKKSLKRSKKGLKFTKKKKKVGGKPSLGLFANSPFPKWVLLGGGAPQHPSACRGKPGENLRGIGSRAGCWRGDLGGAGSHFGVPPPCPGDLLATKQTWLGS